MERTWCKSAPAADVLIKGGRVVDPESGVDAVQDVLISKGKIADTGKGLKPGKNTVRVSLTNSLRNLMGPHHHKGGEHIAVGPATFRANHYWPNKEPGEKDWYDARLGGSAKVWRDDYYMIPFGLLQPPVLVQAE